MKTWIVLMRGINVSGSNIVPMAELRELCTEIGLSGVKTYIQSGNIVFRSSLEAHSLEQKLMKAIEQKFGFVPKLLLLSLDKMLEAQRKNPFPEAEEDPKNLHVYFLREKAPQADFVGMNSIKKESERFELLDQVLYLHAPEGLGRSKLGLKMERLLGVVATARNWRSVSKILELAEAL